MSTVVAALVVGAAVVFHGLCILSASESTSRAAVAFDELFLSGRRERRERRGQDESRTPPIGL